MTPGAAPAPPAPTIHEAERESGPSGAVLWGREIGFQAAVARRQVGLDVVVRGDEIKANAKVAQTIEAAVGAYVRGNPHLQSAGPLALPHFQQQQPPPEGHTFYETNKKKAKKQP